MDPDDRSPARFRRSGRVVGAAAGTILFVLVGGPALAAVVAPWLMSRWQLRPALMGWAPWRWAGAVLIVLGPALVAWSMATFVRRGRATPSPIDRTERVVVVGPFRYIRNPMYIGVVATILAQGLVLGSVPVVIYAAAFALTAHLIVVLYEEPRLTRIFGQDYKAYRRTVPRWLPRLSRER
jgi:protein-S-isoprenylcysteine O-methyltransferase Ste14